MVSKASEDLPEPLSPVITTNWSLGITTSIFLRLCSRAPLMIMLCWSIDVILTQEYLFMHQKACPRVKWVRHRSSPASLSSLQPTSSLRGPTGVLYRMPAPAVDRISDISNSSIFLQTLPLSTKVTIPSPLYRGNRISALNTHIMFPPVGLQLVPSKRMVLPGIPSRS